VERFAYINLFSENIFKLWSCSPWQIELTVYSSFTFMSIAICHSTMNTRYFIDSFKIKCRSRDCTADISEKVSAQNLAMFLRTNKTCGIKGLLTYITALIREKRPTKCRNCWNVNRLVVHYLCPSIIMLLGNEHTNLLWLEAFDSFCSNSEKRYA
jgi:hypothetical protein